MPGPGTSSGTMTAAMISTARVLLAFAVLPLAMALAGYLAFPLVWALAGHRGRPMDSAPAQFAALAAVLCLLVSLIAAPLVLRLARQGRASCSRLLLIGAALGNLPFALYVGLILPATIAHLLAGTLRERLVPIAGLLPGVANAVIIGTSFGMLAAAIVWAIAVPRIVRRARG